MYNLLVIKFHLQLRKQWQHPNGAAKRPPKWYFAKFGFFEGAILYIFGHIPANAYAILAAIFQQEFNHPKFKHPNAIADPRMTTCVKLRCIIDLEHVQHFTKCMIVLNSISNCIPIVHDGLKP